MSEKLRESRICLTKCDMSNFLLNPTELRTELLLSDHVSNIILGIEDAKTRKHIQIEGSSSVIHTVTR